jgi:restriction system protein
VILFAASAIVILMVATSLVGVLAGLRLRWTKGEEGERLVAQILKDLDPLSYRVFHDLYLPRHDGRGTTQIDHVVLSRFGIFVIETKNYDGWIFGGARQQMWTRSIFGRNTQFPNPLDQMHPHVVAVQAFLRLPERSFCPLVFFVDGDFRTEMPENVLCSDLCGWIGARRSILLSEEALQKAVGRMDDLEKTTNRTKAKALHLESLRAIHELPPEPSVVELRISEGGQVVQPAPLLVSPWVAGAVTVSRLQA